MTDDATLIDLARRIAAAKRGEGVMPSTDEMRAQIDAIRIKRSEYRQSSGRTRAAASETKAKASAQQIDLDSLGI